MVKLAKKLTLREELIAMMLEDQKMRARQVVEPDYWDPEIDRRNTERMKDIVNMYGWPSATLVGKMANHAAWLLVQHADHAVSFQEYCLERMKSIPAGEVEKQHIAHLEDRVRVNRKRPQLYGTQFEEIGGEFVPKEIENPDYVDERRHRMGLGTLESAKREIRQKYSQATRED